MNNYTELGIPGVLAAIIFFIVRYFVAAMNKKDDYFKELTSQVIQLNKDTIESHAKLGQALDANTKSNQDIGKGQALVAQATKESSDKLTSLIMKAIKTNGDKK